MARRQRDYHKEYLARQDKARRAGFSSYGSLRHYLERERSHNNPRRNIPVVRKNVAQVAAAQHEAFYGPMGFRTEHEGSRLNNVTRRYYVSVLGVVSPEQWEQWLESEQRNRELDQEDGE